MRGFAHKPLPPVPDVVAPDGSDVRVLLALPGGSMAHFQLTGGATSLAVTHRTIDEIWYILSGRGEMWRRQNTRSDTVELHAGVALTIPLGTHFQFRAFGDAPLCAVAVAMPPWPGEEEAMLVDGPWTPTFSR